MKSLFVLTLVPCQIFVSLAEAADLFSDERISSKDHALTDQDALESKLFLTDNTSNSSSDELETQSEPLSIPSQNTDQNYPGMNKSNSIYSAKPYPKKGLAHLDVTGEFLYLASSVNGLYYAATASDTSIQSSKYYFFDRRYTPAFRIALDYSFNAQGWTLGADWMQLKNSQSQTLNYPYPNGYSGILVYSDINNSYYSEFNSAGGFLSGKQELSFNQVNLDLSKEFFVSKYFSLTPTMAGTFIGYNHNLSTDAGNELLGTFNKVTLKNHYQGFGFKLGGNGRFLCGEGIYLLGSADAGITYGPSRSHKNTSTSSASSNAVNHGVPAYGSDIQTNPSIFLPFIDAKMNLGWRRSFANDSMALDLFAGYEYHLFFDAITILQRTGLFDDTQSLAQITKNLGIQGANFGIKLSF